MGAVETRRIAELMSPCLKYSVEIRGHQVVLRRRAAVADDAVLSDPCRAVIAAIHSTYSPMGASQQQGDLRAVAICTIEPAAAAKHVAFAAQLGEVHIIKPIADRHEEPHSVLDIPALCSSTRGQEDAAHAITIWTPARRLVKDFLVIACLCRNFATAPQKPSKSTSLLHQLIFAKLFLALWFVESNGNAQST